MVYGAILTHEEKSLFCRKPFWFPFRSEEHYKSLLEQRKYFKVLKAPATEQDLDAIEGELKAGF